MAIDKGLMFLNVVWSLTTLVIALVGTIAFVTAQWITAGEAEAAAFNLKEISLGMVHSCYEVIATGDMVCGRYGSFRRLCACTHGAACAHLPFAHVSLQATRWRTFRMQHGGPVHFSLALAC